MQPSVPSQPSIIQMRLQVDSLLVSTLGAGLVARPTSDQQLIHSSAIIPAVDAVMHAQRLDSMHCCLADAGGGLGHNKGLHSPVLPFYNAHPHGHAVSTLLAPGLITT